MMNDYFSDKDVNSVILRYNTRYNEYGYSPKALGWDKGKQDVRFSILTSQYNFENTKILDIGCGFGDLNITLKSKTSCYTYLGIDLIDSFIKEASKRYSNDRINFIATNFMEFQSSDKFDYAISSGVFNHKLSNNKNYEFIESAIEKALDLTNDGIAFDFLSDKVDFRLENTFHSSPERILSIAYKFSRNVILRNDYMPFEFSLFIFKNDKYEKNDTLFERYKTLNLQTV